MEISGKSLEEVDRIIWEEDYFTDESIGRFVGRLSVTHAEEQFLFREAEFDCAFRQVDMEIARLAPDPSASSYVEHRRRIKDIVFEGHDHVGSHDSARAAMAWRRIALLQGEWTTPA